MSDFHLQSPVPQMTLRDWFAGQALATLADCPTPDLVENAAVMAYALADAMLAERTKGETK
jgi:hypothetical protein